MVLQPFWSKWKRDLHLPPPRVWFAPPAECLCKIIMSTQCSQQKAHSCSYPGPGSAQSLLPVACGLGTNMVFSKPDRQGQGHRWDPESLEMGKGMPGDRYTCTILRNTDGDVLTAFFSFFIGWLIDFLLLYCL